MAFAGDELTALLSGSSKSARGSASKGTGVRQKRLLNATVTLAPTAGIGAVKVDGATTPSGAIWPAGYAANVGDRVLVTLIGRTLQVVTASTGIGPGTGVTSVLGTSGAVTKANLETGGVIFADASLPFTALPIGPNASPATPTTLTNKQYVDGLAAVGAWTTPALVSGWSAYDTTSYGTLSYRIEGKRCHLRGLVKYSGSTLPTTSNICTVLPALMGDATSRVYDQLYVQPCSYGNADEVTQMLRVDVNGTNLALNLQPVGTNTAPTTSISWLSLSGISYPVS